MTNTNSAYRPAEPGQPLSANTSQRQHDAENCQECKSEHHTKGIGRRLVFHVPGAVKVHRQENHKRQGNTKNEQHPGAWPVHYFEKCSSQADGESDEGHEMQPFIYV